MENIKSRIIHAFEIVAALMMAAMFATFILQVTIRYTARAEWIKEIFPFLDPTLYGWTLDFCLLMWIWMVFWGNGFIVRQRDHVIFDMLYTSVSPKLRKWLAIISALIIPKKRCIETQTKTKTKSTSCERCDGNVEEEVESMKLLKKPKRSSTRVEAQKEV